MFSGLPGLERLHISDVPCGVPIGMKRQISKSDLDTLLELIRLGDVRIDNESGSYFLYDLKYQTRTTQDRTAWRRLGFDRWDPYRQRRQWIDKDPPPMEIMDEIEKLEVDTIKRRIEPILKSHQAQLIRGTIPLYDLRVESGRSIVYAINGGNTYETRSIWSAIGCKWDGTSKVWYGKAMLSTIYKTWLESVIAADLEKRRLEQEENERRIQQVKEKMDGYLQRLNIDPDSLSEEEKAYYDMHYYNQTTNTYYPSRHYILHTHRRNKMEEYVDRLRKNPSSLSDEERTYYDQNHQSTGHPTWQELYDQFYNQIRQKIVDGVELNDIETNFLVSNRQMAIDDAIRTVKTEEAEAAVNARLARLPALSIAKGEPINPSWVAFVVEAVLMTQDSAQRAIEEEFRTRDLSMATTVIKRDMMLDTPLGRFRIFVRNQPAAQHVVWSLNIQNETLKDVANYALKARDYVQDPVQIRDSKTLIIALNAIASYMLANGHPNLSQTVHDWVKPKP